MAEYQMVVDGFLNKPLTGRRPIETPETEINRENVLKVVMGKAEPIHLLNKNEIRFLHKNQIFGFIMLFSENYLM